MKPAVLRYPQHITRQSARGGGGGRKKKRAHQELSPETIGRNSNANGFAQTYLIGPMGNGSILLGLSLVAASVAGMPFNISSGWSDLVHRFDLSRQKTGEKIRVESTLSTRGKVALQHRNRNIVRKMMSCNNWKQSASRCN